MNKEYLLLAIVFCISLIAAIFTISNYDMWESIRPEFVKLALELSIVMIFGGLIGHLFKKHEQAKDKQRVQLENKRSAAAAHKTLMEEYLKALSHIYRTVKSSRRKLRVHGITPKYNKTPPLDESQIAKYSQELDKINYIQLELEGLVVEAEKLNFLGMFHKFSSQLKSMEQYLRNILNEYEEHYIVMLRGYPLSIAQLPRAYEFTASTSDPLCSNDFLECFWAPYEFICSELSKEIAKLNHV